MNFELLPILTPIADHLVYFNKNLLFSIYFAGNYKKYIKKTTNTTGIHHLIYI